MFGTMARLRPKPGKERELFEMMEQWDSQRRPKVKGARDGYLCKPVDRPDELILFAMFEDRDSYYANANDPEQDRWYQKVRALLEADPIWEDCEIMSAAKERGQGA